MAARQKRNNSVESSVASERLPSPLADALLTWYRASKRDLPWRATKDPYAIWVSEIMLQQTRVEAVIPFYQRFLEQFPSARALAEAPEAELLAAWSGLGYYSRVRNLQKGACMVSEAGIFPRTYDDILALPGVGEYTAAAIASIAFGLPYAVLDGNVLRVMARLYADFGDIGAQQTRRRLKEFAQRHLPVGEAGDYNQALMELGATVCLPRDPRCLLCPLSEHCKGRAEGVQDQLPTKLRRQEMIAVETTLLVVERQSESQGAINGELLLWQRPSSDRMAGFWELPEPHLLPGATLGVELRSFRHSIMNHAHRCRVLEACMDDPPPGFHWMMREKLNGLPLSTMARKALGLSRTTIEKKIDPNPENL
jgi:A/G-specific adenine glycosylase